MWTSFSIVFLAATSQSLPRHGNPGFERLRRTEDPEARYGELGAGSLELEAGSWKLGAGSWELGAGSCYESPRIRHLEAVGLRSAGADHRRRASLDGLRGRGRRAAGQVLRARARRELRRAGTRASVRGCRQAPREPGDREL